MNRLLKNVAGQRVHFRLLTAGNLPNPGVTPDVVVAQDAGGVVAGTGSMTDNGNGLYIYAPTQSETNADEVTFYFGSAAGTYPPEIVAFRTEQPISVGDVVLAAIQPHYAPAKAGDAMTLEANQDVRNILGSVAGSIAGGIGGPVPSPATLASTAVDSILDKADGIQAGLTVRVGLRQIVAALVNVMPGFTFTAHTGPSGTSLKPRLPTKARGLLGITEADLTKLLAYNAENADQAVLSPQLVTALTQIRTALDAVRTSTA